jgi:hypothetical protein
MGQWPAPDRQMERSRKHEYSGGIALVAGQKYDIKVEYYDGTGDANIDLGWSTPVTPKQMIPQSQLYN